MEFPVKLRINDTSNIIMLHISSKDGYINVLENCLHIITNKYGSNGMKWSTKMRKRGYQYIFHSRYYNIQRGGDVNHREIKL